MAAGAVFLRQWNVCWHSVWCKHAFSARKGICTAHMPLRAMRTGCHRLLAHCTQGKMPAPGAERTVLLGEKA